MITRMKGLLTFMKYIFIIVFWVLLSVPVYSQDDNDDSLCLFTNNAGSAIYSLDEITKITFNNNGIQFWTTNWPTEYNYGNVRVISFNAKGNTTSIKPIISDEHGISISYNTSDKTLLVSSVKPISNVEVYNARGVMIASEANLSRLYNIYVGNLSSGIYIIKARIDGELVVKKIAK